MTSERAPSSQAGAESGRRAGGRFAQHANLVRRVTAICLVAAALTIILISNLTSHLQDCVDQVARVGTVPIVRTCDPVSIDSAPVLALVIVAAILLVPDWNVFEIPGIFRLERKVEEQARQQTEVIRLLQQIQVSQRQSLTVALLGSLGELNDKQTIFMRYHPPRSDEDTQQSRQPGHDDEGDQR
jgi:hypothetical protein